MARRGRRVTWHGVYLDYDDLAYAGIVRFVIVTDSVFEKYTSPTIVRIQGCLTFKLNADIDEGVVSTFVGGLIVQPTQLTGLTVAFAEDMSQPWMWTCSGLLWNQPMQMPIAIEGSPGTAGLINTVSDGERKQRIEIDTRVMRKVPHDSQLNLILASAIELGTASNPLKISGNLRVLVKE